jgi:endonuclease/exonuclease/phosphatase family metal-dependent hydrolase
MSPNNLVAVRVLSWNLFHGRDAPPEQSLRTWRSRLLKITERGEEYAQVNRSLFAEFATALAAMSWDVALLQESPPRWAPRLAEALGVEPHISLTSRNRLAPLSGWIAEVNPDLIASGEGGSNLTLVRGALRDRSRPAIAERRELVIHRGLPERRTMAFSRLAASLCVANLHATNDHPEIAAQDVLRAADVALEWAGGAPLLFGGDLNLRPAEQPEVFAALRERYGLAPATGPRSIDHLLARGLEVVEPPAPLSDGEVERAADFRGPLGLWRREAGRRIRLSDHAPVGATYELPSEPQAAAQEFARRSGDEIVQPTSGAEGVGDGRGAKQ